MCCLRVTHPISREFRQETVQKNLEIFVTPWFLCKSAIQSPDEQRPMSAHAQLFGSTTDDDSPRLLTDEGVCEGSSSSGPVSPVYQSEAARAIVQEMTRRRAVPKTKRRHHTVAGGAQQQNNAIAANMMVAPRSLDRSTLSVHSLTLSLHADNYLIFSHSLITNANFYLFACVVVVGAFGLDAFRKQTQKLVFLSLP